MKENELLAQSVALTKFIYLMVILECPFQLTSVLRILRKGWKDKLKPKKGGIVREWTVSDEIGNVWNKCKKTST